MLLQQKVYREVIDVIGVDGKILPNHIRKLEYTERVVKEVLRLFPIAPILGREINAEIPIGEMNY